MSDLKNQKLSGRIIKDFRNFARTGEDPIFWLAKGKDVSIDEIITRMQSANIFTIANLGIKTADEWEHSRPARTVRKTVAPITENGSYSSFALIENDNRYGKLRYPLVASFISDDLPFATKTFQDYSSLIKKIKSSYKVKIIEKNDSGEIFSYKRKVLTAKLKNVGYGALNLCRKMFRKKILKPSPSYKGKIVINSTIGIGNNRRYKFSEQEKITRILYALISAGSKEFAKENKTKLDKKVMAYVNLYASILVSRAIDYGTDRSNRMVEASLSLQMCNTLAGLDIDSETLKSASKLGMQTALFTIDKLGISKQSVMQAMRATGYTYYSVPETIEEALVPKRTLVNEEDFVKGAEKALGVKPVTQEAERSTAASETAHKEEATEQKHVAEKKHIKDALDNPKPDTVIYVPPMKQDKKEEKEEKTDYYTVDFGDMEDTFMLSSDLFKKVRDLKHNEGVKTKDVYLTKGSAEKYIDKVVLSALSDDIDRDFKKINSGEDTSAAVQRAKRRYNYLEHIYSYYDKNKLQDSEALKEDIEKELVSSEAGDNVYAHSFAKSIVDLRKGILTGIFGDEEKILKPENKEIATVVNDYAQDKYKSRLSTYVKSSLRKCLKTVFKEIDSKSFEQKNLVEPESSKE